jgi:hypothetical protein
LIIRGSGYLLLSNKKREKTGLSRERGINGLVNEWLAGLCRESPFTASYSEATFAVTDDQPTHTRQSEKQPTNGLANEKLTVIFTLTNVLYATEKVENGKQPKT